MMSLKRLVSLFFLFFLLIVKVQSQDFSLKTNTLFWGTLTPNLGAEFKLSNKYTTDILAAYRPWNKMGDRTMRFWLFQPGVRRWLCEPYEGHFLGAHLHGAQYYMADGKKVYDGYLVGAGLSYGYQWILSPRWSIEAEIGAGYAYLWYKRRPDLPCKKCIVNKYKNYVGVTKAAVSLIYVF